MIFTPQNKTDFLFTGKDAGFHYILFFCSSLGAVTFERKYKKLIITSMILPVFLFLILDFLGSHLVIRYLFSGVVLQALRISAILIAFTCTLFTIGFYISQNAQLLFQKQI